jgi:hypothetical protein
VRGAGAMPASLTHLRCRAPLYSRKLVQQDFN